MIFFVLLLVAARIKATLTIGKARKPVAEIIRGMVNAHSDNPQYSQLPALGLGAAQLGHDMLRLAVGVLVSTLKQ